MSHVQSAHLEKPLGGRYKIINPLGEGGFGQTFLAEDLHLPNHPQCVVKQLKPQASDAETWQTARRLFDMEAQVLYKLGNHEQIPRLLAHFEEGQEFYLAQELVAGETLTQFLVEGQPWSEVNVATLLQDILQVLAFVHQHRVIHRDIKPANLICRQEDGKMVLIDFGAVKQVSSQLANAKAGKTQTIAIGTQGYMPSEQLAGNPRFSSDVYAVGMIGIQALTGIHPHHLSFDPQTSEINWHEHATHVSSELVAILDRMVRYDFRTRYPTALEALEAVRSLSTVSATPSPLPQPAAKPNAPDGVTVTLPHYGSQPQASVSVSNALDDVTVTLAHRALPPLSPVIPATIPVTLKTANTVQGTPALRERRSSGLWLPTLGGAIAAIAAMSLGAALLKAQQPVPLANEAPNSTASSVRTSFPKETHREFQPPAPILTPLPQPSTAPIPSDKPTSTSAKRVNPSVREVSQPQLPPIPITPPPSPPTRKVNPSVRGASQPQPTPIAPPLSKGDPPISAISYPQFHPPAIGNQPPLDGEVAREYKRPARDVEPQTKATAKAKEREATEVTKQQERRGKKAAEKDKPQKGIK
ncbi:MAG TPA: protein kinase [Waterburya sp.]|jgi:serine/threonine protein kinase